MNWKEVTERCIRFAKDAGQAVEMLGAGTLKLHLKEDASYLTEADLKSECILLPGLRSLKALGLDYPCLSEESLGSFTGNPKNYWCVDPLDGTRDFFEGTGDYTINIALVLDGEPVLGVVYAPHARVCYYAYPEGGAWMSEDGKTPHRIHARKPSLESLIAVVSRYHSDLSLIRSLESISGLQIKKVGSSIKFCNIASGKADLYPRLSDICEWDIAAAHCILRASGGEIFGLDLKPVVYSGMAPWRMGPIMAVGSRETSWISIRDKLTHNNQ